MVGVTEVRKKIEKERAEDPSFHTPPPSKKGWSLEEGGWRGDAGRVET